MTFDEHVNKVVSEYWYHLRNIRKIKCYLTSEEAHKLIHAMISSKVDYCNVLMYGMKSSTITKKTSIAKLHASSVVHLLESQSLIQFFMICTGWKYKKGLFLNIFCLCTSFFIGSAPVYFADLLLVKSSSEHLLYTRFMNTVSGRCSFSYAAPRFWKRLPAASRMEENTEHFKKLIKTALFRNTNNIMQAIRMYNAW